ncbi:LPXTG cell wall anchor domain-containing protein [Trueperella pecoris]|uniref:LPXTG cell wall anchor domain-containing protein n=1 Tax=Trueperella pecoris TaxID=2733571 RepID=A0A7M1QTA9_9ACTO|nr:LPXTG cell wall anchor domain-containing protein [Trueperella pecoris]QOR44734.1 LPXTG cell wall anchor domain-containing protein [Trueperella pecoris]
MQTNIRRSILILLLGAALAVLAPSASAAERHWERLSSEDSRWAGITSEGVPIAVCTGDTQLNFTFQQGLENADFTSYTETVAGEEYVRHGTERGPDTTIAASKTGVAAAVLDLWGSQTVDGVPPEVFTIALHELAGGGYGISATGNAEWREQARDLLGEAAKLAGPHRAGDISYGEASVTGFTVVGRAGMPISGIPFRAELSGGVWADTGQSVLEGYTQGVAQRFAISESQGELAIRVVYTNIPGHSLKTGHHEVAQDMHMPGERGTVEQEAVLRQAVPNVAISTRASVDLIGDNATITDMIKVDANAWPVEEGQAAVYDIVADLYGPFDSQLPEQKHVPEGLVAHSTIPLSINAPGEYGISFDDRIDSGWYTVVVRGEFQGRDEPAARVVMPFFEPAETVFVERPSATPIVPATAPVAEVSPNAGTGPARELPNTGGEVSGLTLLAVGLAGGGGALLMRRR